MYSNSDFVYLLSNNTLKSYGTLRCIGYLCITRLAVCVAIMACRLQDLVSLLWIY